jgi:hypothetical protein
MGEHLLRIVMNILTYIFMVGMAGSFLVSFLVMISFADELKNFFSEE